MDSRTVIRILEEDSWYKAAQKGSHIQFKHPVKKGRTTVAHPQKDIALGTLRSIGKQSGVKFYTTH